MKISILELAPVLIALCNAPVFAGEGRGGDVGNGGGAIVCRDAQSRVTFAQLYEFWEFGDKTVPESNDVPAAELSTAALERVRLLNPELAAALSDELKRYQASVEKRLQEPPVALNLTLDSRHVRMPIRCPNDPTARPTYEQVVNYTDEGQVYVDSEIYGALSQTSQAGLAWHEAMYKLLRDARKERDSRQTRSFVATLFGSATNEELIQSLNAITANTPFAPEKILQRELWSPLSDAAREGDIQRFIHILQERRPLHGEIQVIPGFANYIYWLHGNFLNLELRNAIRNQDGDEILRLRARSFSYPQIDSQPFVVDGRALLDALFFLRENTRWEEILVFKPYGFFDNVRSFFKYGPEGDYSNQSPWGGRTPIALTPYGESVRKVLRALLNKSESQLSPELHRIRYFSFFSRTKPLPSLVPMSVMLDDVASARVLIEGVTPSCVSIHEDLPWSEAMRDLVESYRDRSNWDVCSTRALPKSKDSL